MSPERRCLCCGQCFRPRPQNPTQSYCSESACQKERKRQWQQSKRVGDPDYRANERAAQRRWAEAHPQYWQDWRERHPEYVERNRAAQRQRNARRRQEASEQPPSSIAKVDAWTPERPLAPGTYRLERWTGPQDCKCGRVGGQNVFVISAVASG